MKIELNNKPYEVKEHSTLATLAEELDLAKQGVAIAIDYQVIARAQWAETPLKEGDRLMVVRAVSGG